MPSRLRSLDIFRGFTILTMIFVNDVASVANIPWWMKHMPQTEDGMTFVDVVFPAFLFIVGMSIPFALDKRIKDETSRLTILWHIIVRSSGLLFLGVLMVNMHGINTEATGLSSNLWSLSVFIFAIPLWTIFPRDRKRLGQWIKIIAFLGVVALMAIYRGGPAGQTHWLQTSWWGILGLIGWAYLACALLYLAARKRTEVIIAMVGVFTLLFIGDKAGVFNSLGIIREYIYIGGHIGGHGLISCAGMATAMMIRDESMFPKIATRLKMIFAFAISLSLLAFLLSASYGINKVAATPSWGLYSAAICIVIFMGLYYIVDMKGHLSWAAFIAPAGENPLLAYILPDIYYALIGILSVSFAGTVFGSGMPGILRSLVVAVMALQLTGLLTRWNVRMRF